MEKFNYKKSADILALSASISEFTYKKHCHEEYAIGVTLRGIQQYNLDGKIFSYPIKMELCCLIQSNRMMAAHMIGQSLIMSCSISSRPYY